MRALSSFIAVLLLVAVAYVLAEGANMRFLLGVVIPYAAVAVFIIGMIARVLKWGSSPVPFRIPTTCGQQKSLPWIKSSFLESPHNTIGVIGRMVLEVLFFRSLFRNSKVQLREGKPIYGGAKWLWLAGLAFHWSFLIIVFRHFRFFFEPVPGCVNLLATLDGLFEIGVPTIFLTDGLLLVSVTYLFLRRVAIPARRSCSIRRSSSGRIRPPGRRIWPIRRALC